MLSWQWYDKIGEVIYEDGHAQNLYKGNALMIAVEEHKEDQTYTLAWFACDRVHLRNMLGLSKGTANCMKDWGISGFRFDLNYKEVHQIVTDLIKAKMNLRIDFYNGI